MMIANSRGISDAVVQDIQRMSTEDGPGIRTTVFLKGCNLKCLWCHNPESISPIPQIGWVGSRCIGCKTCVNVCLQKAISISPTGIVIDRNLCSNCGACAEECPSTALQLLGRRLTLHALAREVAKDRVYFEKSGGGVTVSGGEPLVQASFVSVLLSCLKALEIHTALDTSGFCETPILDSLLPYTDLLLFDIKEIDSSRHRQWTGVSNEKILENLVFVSNYMKDHAFPAQLWIRTPVIPGATAREDNIRRIGEFIASRLDGKVARWELCAFNNLCKDKYERLGMDWPFKNTSLLNSLFMDELADVARNSGVNPEIVKWTGLVAIEA